MSAHKLTDIKGVGEKRAKLFKKLGVLDADALLYYYPRRYIDLSSPCSPADAPYDEPCAVKATVIHPPVEHRIRKGMTLYKFTASGDGTALEITLFNQKYAAQKIRTNQEYIFYGTVGGNLFNRKMTSPDIIQSDSAYIRPVYHCCDGLSSSVIESTMRSALDFSDDIEDPIPQYIREKYRLPGISASLKAIHFPQNPEQLKSARRRLMFQELLMLQCGMLFVNSNRSVYSAAGIDDHSSEFEHLLPFNLTNAQKRSISDSISDMQSGKPMNRLLQGDVGSGKTAVAASLIMSVVMSGHQAALMAPTEILAEQHYKSLSKMFRNTDMKIVLLTGSTKDKKERCELIASGKADLAIGTHALIENNVRFSDLQLVITDEQHRFGVAQRASLIAKGTSPHVLVMSATPIPRTLALMIYGDLDVSVLDELPPGRKPIITRWVKSSARPKVYDFIKAQLDAGRQAYVICPLVENNESDLIPATDYYNQLSQNEFSDYKIALLHGKMKSSEKDCVMRDFSEGKYHMIISTTVIEVGIDVPNSTVILIENADRFGLSQLHQLRGRVGRGQHRSYCIMISDTQNEVSAGRLNEMCATNDGFKIAEYDLKSRGPGDFFGRRQHGLPSLKLADLLTDCKALNFAQEIAREIHANDPNLSKPEHQTLKNSIDVMFDQTKGELN